jgi:2-isopropylmalate synthase
MRNQGYVRIFDTTLRDGEQTPGVRFTARQKADIARMLEDFGVDTVEAGFPAASPGDFAGVRAVAEAVTRCEVAALARCVPADVEAAAQALRPARRPVIHVFAGTSEVQMRTNGMTRAETVRRIEDSVARARRHVAEVEFSAVDATGSDPVFLRQCVYAAVTAGATRVNIADTNGRATPDAFGRLVADMVDFVEGRAIVSAHCHDDLGMALANTVAAVRHGAGQVETASSGLGARAGNAGLEEVAAALTAEGIARTGADPGAAGRVRAAVAAAVAESGGLMPPAARMGCAV